MRLDRGFFSKSFSTKIVHLPKQPTELVVVNWQTFITKKNLISFSTINCTLNFYILYDYCLLLSHLHEHTFDRIKNIILSERARFLFHPIFLIISVTETSFWSTNFSIHRYLDDVVVIFNSTYYIFKQQLLIILVSPPCYI